MTMMQPGGNQFPPKAPTTKLTDITPGSTVAIADNKNQQPPFSGTVLEVKREYGVTSIPAIIVKVDGAIEPVVVTDSGRWRVSVTFDSRLMAADVNPDSLVVARRKPETVRCVQFKGGVESATEIIRWAGGRAHILWERGGMGTDEHLALSSMRGVMPVAVGDYLMEGIDGEFYPCTPSAFTAGYDVVDPGEFRQAEPVQYLDPTIPLPAPPAGQLPADQPYPMAPSPENVVPWGEPQQFQAAPQPPAWDFSGPSPYEGAQPPEQARQGFIQPTVPQYVPPAQ